MMRYSKTLIQTLKGHVKLENFCLGLIETIMEIDDYNKTIIAIKRLILHDYNKQKWQL